jgi:hypothetical protein
VVIIPDFLAIVVGVAIGTAAATPIAGLLLALVRPRTALYPGKQPYTLPTVSIVHDDGTLEELPAVRDVPRLPGGR